MKGNLTRVLLNTWSFTSSLSDEIPQGDKVVANGTKGKSKERTKEASLSEKADLIQYPDC